MREDRYKPTKRGSADKEQRREVDVTKAFFSELRLTKGIAYPNLVAELKLLSKEALIDLQNLIGHLRGNR